MADYARTCLDLGLQRREVSRNSGTFLEDILSEASQYCFAAATNIEQKAMCIALEYAFVVIGRALLRFVHQDNLTGVDTKNLRRIVEATYTSNLDVE